MNTKMKDRLFPMEDSFVNFNKPPETMTNAIQKAVKEAMSKPKKLNETKEGFATAADLANDINGTTNGSDLADANGIVEDYYEMTEKREEMESKIEEMETPSTDIDIQHNSTVYMTLVLTVLGTSVLYYFFKKL